MPRLDYDQYNQLYLDQIDKEDDEMYFEEDDIFEEEFYEKYFDVSDPE